MMTCMLVTLALLTVAGAARGQEPTKVPFDTLKSRHMVVEVFVNDKGPFRLIFDTGAPTSLVSQRLAREAGVIDPKKKSLGSLFGNLGAQKLKSVKIGGLKLTNVDAMVMDHPIVELIASALNQRIDGIIGFNVFARYQLAIDYQAKLVSFTPGTFVPVDMMQAMMTMMFPSLNDLERIPVLRPKGLFGVRVEKASGDDAGVVVREVYTSGPAEKAGIKVGDRLLTVDGRWTDFVNDCYEAARELRPGRDAEVQILRDGKKQTLKVRIAAGF